MNKPVSILGLLGMLSLLAVPAYAVAESVPSEGPAPVRTLADFQAQYLGTKPVVAVQKYWEYQAMQMAPRPTLSVQRMRENQGGLDTMGTKPVVGVLKKLEGKK